MSRGKLLLDNRGVQEGYIYDCKSERFVECPEFPESENKEEKYEIEKKVFMVGEMTKENDEKGESVQVNEVILIQSLGNIEGIKALKRSKRELVEKSLFASILCGDHRRGGESLCLEQTGAQALDKEIKAYCQSVLEKRGLQGLEKWIKERCEFGCSELETQKIYAGKKSMATKMFTQSIEGKKLLKKERIDQSSRLPCKNYKHYGKCLLQ